MKRPGQIEPDGPPINDPVWVYGDEEMGTRMGIRTGMGDGVQTGDGNGDDISGSNK